MATRCPVPLGHSDRQIELMHYRRRRESGVGHGTVGCKEIGAAGWKGFVAAACGDCAQRGAPPGF